MFLEALNGALLRCEWLTSMQGNDTCGVRLSSAMMRPSLGLSWLRTSLMTADPHLLFNIDEIAKKM